MLDACIYIYFVFSIPVLYLIAPQAKIITLAGTILFVAAGFYMFEDYGTGLFVGIMSSLFLDRARLNKSRNL